MTNLAPSLDRTFLLTSISWESYDRLLAIIGNQPVHLTYDRGLLELMSPSYNHERYKKRLGRLVEILTEELNLPMIAGGSATFRRQDLDRGLEPDECFYIQNVAAVQGKAQIDLAVDPPPDLVIEIDVASSSLDRMSIYAAMGVTEVWRYKDRELIFYQLDPTIRQYRSVTYSLTFAFLAAADVIRFLQTYSESNDTELYRALRSWIQRYYLE
ncbi:Uma2 family endonuclease [Gloeobacter morelensis]|uniref:Uma2 family endonuclease n=1 Tax=Gloeobacter morelensis MG652769 TaxID=2781736 RepID=A0ABY3PLX3_9CYAN|nr:Uma2 family endonuclease [Gloeobacter morelensis]UFP94656.1 Uma2 family endonuclease [Gloeobacter morelensis MG652769]